MQSDEEKLFIRTMHACQTNTAIYMVVSLFSVDLLCNTLEPYQD